MRDERDESGPPEETPDEETPGEVSAGTPSSPAPEHHEAAAPQDATEQPSATEQSSATDQSSITSQRSVTGLQPTTGVPTGTAPRAVLRPVPDGFPTPPPRPARPNRAPALPAQESAPAPRRTPVYVLLAVIAVLVLVVGLGGGFLVFRALSGESPESSGPAATSEDAEAADPGSAADGSSAALGEATATLVSAERATEIDPDASTPLTGEFLIVTLDIQNPADSPLRLADRVTLVTSQGEEVAQDQAASRRHEESGVESQHENYIQPGSRALVHLVFEVGEGTEGVELEFALDSDEEPGVLPLT